MNSLAVRLVTGAHDYEFDTPDDAEVHAFITATVNGKVLHPVTLEQLYDIYPKWPNQDANEYAEPRYVTQLDPDNFSVAPIPDASQNYDVSMIVCLKTIKNSYKNG